jgi:hypothetical protein
MLGLAAIIALEKSTSCPFVLYAAAAISQMIAALTWLGVAVVYAIGGGDGG